METFVETLARSAKLLSPETDITVDDRLPGGDDPRGYPRRKQHCALIGADAAML